MSNDLILTATLHDPTGGLRYLIKEIGPKLLKQFKDTVICLTSSTDEEIKINLEKIGFHVVIEEGTIINKSYKKALDYGMTFLPSNDAKVMYIDFDRLLHWYKFHEEEFEKILTEYDKYDFVLIGRTERAHKSHHEALYKTEIILNTFFSHVLNLDKRMDMLCANWIMTKALVEKILSIQLYSSTGFYIFWPYQLWIQTKNKLYIEVEGQEYETPDRYTEEIKKLGYEGWIKTLETSKEWHRRVSLMNDTFIEFMNHGQFVFESSKEF